jgi:cytidylate kinase
VVLQNEPSVLKILVVGAVDNRVKRLASAEGLTDDAARAAVHESDKDRVGFFKQTYAVDLLNASLYDLTLSTDQLAVQTAADLVVAAAKNVAGIIPEA